MKKQIVTTIFATIVVLFSHGQTVNVGDNSGTATTNNSFFGAYSGQNSIGNYNSFFGYTSGKNNQGTGNSFYGYSSGGNNQGDYNAFYGYASGRDNTTATNNAFFGTSSGVKTTTGSYNTFVGHSSGYNNTSGESNVFLGMYSGLNNTTGTKNTYIGRSAGYTNIEGENNAYVGYGSGLYSIGSNNVFQGTYAGLGYNNDHYSNLGTTRPITNNNTLIGYAAGRLNEGNGNVSLGYAAGEKTQGDYNLNLGYAAAYNNQSGNRNVFLGFYSGYDNSGSNNIFIGNESGRYETGSNKLYIESSNSSTPLIYGDFSSDIVNINGKLGIGTTSPDEKLTVKGKIHAQEVRVDINGPIAPDYVFEKYFKGESKLNPNYNMPTLEEVEAYTKANNHLPEVPSAQEMEANGIQLKEMNLKLLQKIEELTLYTIEQQKEIKLLKSQVSKNKELEKRLDKIEKLLSTIED